MSVFRTMDVDVPIVLFGSFCGGFEELSMLVNCSIKNFFSVLVFLYSFHNDWDIWKQSFEKTMSCKCRRTIMAICKNNTGNDLKQESDYVRDLL